MTISFAINAVTIGRRTQKTQRLPRNLNRVRGLHWAEVHKWSQAWKHAAGWNALAALDPKSRYDAEFLERRKTVTITLHACQEMDRDNAYTAVKPILDGLKGIVIVDDKSEYCDLRVEQCKVSHRADERVTVEVV